MGAGEPLVPACDRVGVPDTSTIAASPLGSRGLRVLLLRVGSRVDIALEQDGFPVGTPHGAAGAGSDLGQSPRLAPSMART